MSRLRLVISSLFLFLFVVLPVSVFSSDPASEALPEVVVTSTRLPGAPADPRTLPAKVTVVTAEDLQRQGAKTVHEAVQQATGIVMHDQVGIAFKQTVDVRTLN